MKLSSWVLGCSSLLLASLTHAQPSQATVSLLHRLSSSSAWSPLGTVSLEGAAGVLSLDPKAGDITPVGLHGEGDYQVGVGSEEGTVNYYLTVNPCLVAPFTATSITLQLSAPSSPHGPRLLSLHPSPSLTHPCPSAPFAALSGSTFSHFKVALDEPHQVTPIRWKDAPPIVVGADGKAVTPEPEKTFIQKYGWYIAPLLLYIVLTPGGGPAEEQAAAPK